MEILAFSDICPNAVALRQCGQCDAHGWRKCCNCTISTCHWCNGSNGVLSGCRRTKNKKRCPEALLFRIFSIIIILVFLWFWFFDFSTGFIAVYLTWKLRNFVSHWWYICRYDVDENTFDVHLYVYVHCRTCWFHRGRRAFELRKIFPKYKIQTFKSNFQQCFIRDRFGNQNITKKLIFNVASITEYLLINSRQFQVF